MGLPVDNVRWNTDDPESYTYAPVDDDTRVTIRDLERIRDRAFQSQDYEMLKQVSADLKILYQIGNEILNPKRELEFVVVKEDFETAIEIRNKLKKLEQKRDSYDAVYETSRFESLVSMAEPTAA